MTACIPVAVGSLQVNKKNRQVLVGSWDGQTVTVNKAGRRGSTLVPTKPGAPMVPLHQVPRRKTRAIVTIPGVTP